MTISIAAAALVALLAAEALPQNRLTPALGAAIWLGSLALRALAAVALTAVLLSYVPATEVFALVTAWCLDGVAPLFSSHRGVSGHGLGETVLLLPGLALTISLVWALVALCRGLRTVAHRLKGSAVGTGPAGSMIVAGPEVLVAASGLREPRIIVSAGALAQLDEDELEVSLEHERGHIVRRHRYVLVVATLLFAIARFAPGSRTAFDRLSFHLERDADEFALRQGGDSLALASAICKATRSSAGLGAAAATHLAGADTASRLKLLLRPPAGGGTLARWSARSAATLLVGATLIVGLSVPGLAATAASQLHLPSAIAACG